MGHLAITIPAAVLPSVLLWDFTSSDPFPEPRRALLKSFALSLLIVLPVLLL